MGWGEGGRGVTHVLVVRFIEEKLYRILFRHKMRSESRLHPIESRVWLPLLLGRLSRLSCRKCGSDDGIGSSRLGGNVG